MAWLADDGSPLTPEPWPRRPCAACAEMDGWGCQEHQAAGSDAVGPGPVDVRFKVNAAAGDIEYARQNATVEDLHRAVEHMATVTPLSRDEVREQLAAMFGVPANLLFGTSPSGFEVGRTYFDAMRTDLLRRMPPAFITTPTPTPSRGQPIRTEGKITKERWEK